MSEKRFVVVNVNGQWYECERPFGVTFIRPCWEIEGGRVVRVWVEAAPDPSILSIEDRGESPEEIDE